MPLNHFNLKGKFRTESGFDFQGLRLAYTVHGTLNEQKTNVIWVFHALTANSDPAEWWPGMVGEGCVFDPHKYFIICVNMPGSCYGSSGPLDTNPDTGKPWHHDFPLFTISDMVKAYRQLRDQLGIKSVELAVGGSTGGMQALEWAIQEPDFIRKLVLIATSARHSPWGIAFNASQRMAIEADHTWMQRTDQAGIEGMKVARSIALISYRSYEAYGSSQQDDSEQLQHYKAESYQKYQGEKLSKRFNAFSYYQLSLAMDAHHAGRHRESIEVALGSIKAQTLVIGISTDQLFPPADQQFLATHVKGSRLEIIDSLYGHDGFLLEFNQLSKLILNNHFL